MDYPLLDIPGLINDPKDVKEYILSIENKLVNEKKITFSARDIQRLLPKDIDFKNSVITPTFAKPKRPLENGSSPTLKKSNLKMVLLRLLPLPLLLLAQRHQMVLHLI